VPALAGPETLGSGVFDLEEKHLREHRSVTERGGRGDRPAPGPAGPGGLSWGDATGAFLTSSTLAVSGVPLLVVGWLGLRRLRARRLPAAAGRGPFRAGEAAAFAGLALAGCAALAAPVVPGARAAEALAATLFCVGVALWLARDARRTAADAGGGPELVSALLLLAAAAALAWVGDAAGIVARLAAAAAGVQLLRFGAEREHARAARPLPGAADAFEPKEVLKTDLFGRIELGAAPAPGGPLPAVRRDFRAGALWLRPVAAVLARREARALGWLTPLEGVPRLVDRGRGRFLRSYLDGRRLAEVAPRDPEYFVEARRLLRRIHALGVTHNDTHKVHNWLVTPEGRPALVDFQIAGRHAARTRWFRLCALEDLRHLLKHKRRFCPEALTAREHALLARRSWIARGWLATVKPVYMVVTRRVLRWRDDEGRGPPLGPR
jgi:hypothetical protein